jgi:hypothetical protein
MLLNEDFNGRAFARVADGVLDDVANGPPLYFVCSPSRTPVHFPRKVIGMKMDRFLCLLRSQHERSQRPAKNYDIEGQQQQQDQQRDLSYSQQEIRSDLNPNRSMYLLSLERLLGKSAHRCDPFSRKATFEDRASGGKTAD